MSLLADHFMACRKPTDFYRLQILSECDSVPLEIAALFRHRAMLPKEASEWVERMRRMMFAQSKTVQPFWMRRIAQHVALYSTRKERGETRDLLVAFCGLADRLQIPIPAMLQHLDGSRYDVLLLRDPTKRIYLQGVPGYAPDLAQVAERIRRELNLGIYRTIRSFGTSGGGWAAFTVGTMLGADRAIAMSGKPPGASFRLARMWEKRGYSLDEQDADFDVFRRLFEAIPERSTRLLAIFGADYEPDREGAEAFEQLVDAVGIGYAGVNDHNLMFELLKAKRLASFLDRYLTGDLDAVIPPLGERTLAMDSLGALPASPGSREPRQAPERDSRRSI